MAWMVLFLAGLMECGWAVGLKYTQGFTRLWPSVWTVLSMAASVLGLGYAMKSIPVGTAYAVWTGIGAVGVAVLGMLLFDESKTWMRLISILLIVAGVIGLRVFTKGPGAVV